MNGDIYIVGGGSSLKDFNFECLRNKTTITVNAALKVVPDPDVFLTADTWYCGIAAKMRFWNKRCHKIMVVGPDHKMYKRAKPYLKYYDRIIMPYSYDSDISLDAEKFATGRNSGFCAFQYSLFCQPRVIHLLGFDFHTDDGDHFHDDYKVAKSRLEMYASNFIKAIIKLKTMAHDLKIISHSVKSPLNDHIEYQPLGVLL